MVKHYVRTWYTAASRSLSDRSALTSSVLYYELRKIWTSWFSVMNICTRNTTTSCGGTEQKKKAHTEPCSTQHADRCVRGGTSIIRWMCLEAASTREQNEAVR